VRGETDVYLNMEQQNSCYIHSPENFFPGCTICSSGPFISPKNQILFLKNSTQLQFLYLMKRFKKLLDFTRLPLFILVIPPCI
jgi:hypothetical protein